VCSARSLASLAAVQDLWERHDHRVSVRRGLLELQGPKRVRSTIQAEGHQRARVPLIKPGDAQNQGGAVRAVNQRGFSLQAAIHSAVENHLLASHAIQDAQDLIGIADLSGVQRSQLVNGDRVCPPHATRPPRGLILFEICSNPQEQG
jgi:hypothetical protein